MGHGVWRHSAHGHTCGLTCGLTRGLSAIGFHGLALSSGLPVPREPAYAAKRSQDGEARAASE